MWPVVAAADLLSRFYDYDHTVSGNLESASLTIKLHFHSPFIYLFKWFGDVKRLGR